MSRTDRHRPGWVQLADPCERDKRWFDDRWILLFRACQCRTYWCNSSTWRKPLNRRERHEVQRCARDAVKGGDWE